MTVVFVKRREEREKEGSKGEEGRRRYRVEGERESLVKVVVVARNGNINSTVFSRTFQLLRVVEVIYPREKY